LKASVGQLLPVLFETQEDGMWFGHSDTYLLTSAEGEKLRGLVKSVKITGVSGENLVGKIV
jgi:threonylcarbamoyladenosine tRNA methylthiotransferase MtaB